MEVPLSGTPRGSGKCSSFSIGDISLYNRLSVWEMKLMKGRDDQASV